MKNYLFHCDKCGHVEISKENKSGMNCAKCEDGIYKKITGEEIDDIYYPELNPDEREYINSYYEREDVTALRVGCAIVIVTILAGLTALGIWIFN